MSDAKQPQSLTKKRKLDAAEAEAETKNHDAPPSETNTFTISAGGKKISIYRKTMPVAAFKKTIEDFTGTSIDIDQFPDPDTPEQLAKIDPLTEDEMTALGEKLASGRIESLGINLFDSSDELTRFLYWLQKSRLTELCIHTTVLTTPFFSCVCKYLPSTLTRLYFHLLDQNPVYDSIKADDIIDELRGHPGMELDITDVYVDDVARLASFFVDNNGYSNRIELSSKVYLELDAAMAKYREEKAKHAKSSQLFAAPPQSAQAIDAKTEEEKRPKIVDAT